MALANGFTNDQFLHLAGAQQLRLGDWPTRDFLDPGMPLMYVVSAAAQLLLGPTLFAEAVLIAIAFALAAVFTALTVRQLTGSAWLALVAAGLTVAIVPRAYGYPKILMYAAVFLLVQRYVTRPGTGRLLALALSVVVAFLFRHDHGIYLGAGATLAVLTTPHAASRQRWQSSIRPVLTFAAVVIAFALPYLAYVQVNGGLWAYVQKGLEFRNRELTRAGYFWPSLLGEDPLQAWLFYEYLLLPVAAAMTLVALRRRDDIRTIAAQVLPVVIVAALVDTTIVRPPLIARLPDAIVPGVTLGAWLLACAWRARSEWRWRVPTGALAVLAVASIVVPNHTLDHVAGAGMLRPFWRWPDHIRLTRERLTAPHAEQMLPSVAAKALVPFYDYVGRCTAARDRLLIVGLIPEAAVFARRGFAGGQAALFSGYYEDERYQRSIVNRLRREAVPLVLVQGESADDDFDSTFPIVAGYVRARYVPLATVGDARGPGGVSLLRLGSQPVTPADGVTGWPCQHQRVD